MSRDVDYYVTDSQGCRSQADPTPTLPSSPASPCSRTMENLDQLSATGLPVSDLNRENLLSSDW